MIKRLYQFNALSNQKIFLFFLVFFLVLVAGVFVMSIMSFNHDFNVISAGLFLFLGALLYFSELAGIGWGFVCSSSLILLCSILSLVFWFRFGPLG